MLRFSHGIHVAWFIFIKRSGKQDLTDITRQELDG
jgi:hypothetical protein